MDSFNTQTKAITIITFEVDTARLASCSDEYLAQLWYVGQANPAPFGDPQACAFAESVGREIIRRWVCAANPALWSHQACHMQAASNQVEARAMSTKPKFAGLSDAQVLSLFEQIATTLNLLASMCREKGEALGGHDAALAFFAMENMLCGVGALADMPTGGNCVGSFADWMVGPLFNKTSGEKHE